MRGALTVTSSSSLPDALIVVAPVLVLAVIMLMMLRGEDRARAGRSRLPGAHRPTELRRSAVRR